MAIPTLPMPLYGLRNKRRSAGITQQALADRACLAINSVRRAESGARVTQDTAERLAAALSCHFLDLFLLPPGEPYPAEAYASPDATNAAGRDSVADR